MTVRNHNKEAPDRRVTHFNSGVYSRGWLTPANCAPSSPRGRVPCRWHGPYAMCAPGFHVRQLDEISTNCGRNAVIYFAHLRLYQFADDDEI